MRNRLLKQNKHLYNNKKGDTNSYANCISFDLPFNFFPQQPNPLRSDPFFNSCPRFQNRAKQIVELMEKTTKEF